MSKILLKNALLISLSSLVFFPLTTSWAGQKSGSVTLQAVSGNGTYRPCNKNSLFNCLITLNAGGANAMLTVINNSTVTVTNISAYIPAALVGVTQDASLCTSVPPNSSCIIFFYPGATTAPRTAVEIAGDNSRPAFVDIEVV